MNSLTYFQQSLDAELQERAAQLPPEQAAAPTRRARPRRRVLIAVGAVAAAAAVAVAVPATTGGGTQAAYAVTPHSDGTVSIKLFDPKDLAALQAELRRLGIPMTAMVATQGCTEALPPTGATLKRQLGQIVVAETARPAYPAITEVIRPSAIPDGETLLLAMDAAPATPTSPSGTSSQVVESTYRLVHQVPSCIAFFGPNDPRTGASG